MREALHLTQVLSSGAEFGFPGMLGPGFSGDGVDGSEIPSSDFWGTTAGRSVG